MYAVSKLRLRVEPIHGKLLELTPNSYSTRDKSILKERASTLFIVSSLNLYRKPQDFYRRSHKYRIVAFILSNYPGIPIHPSFQLNQKPN